MNVGFAQPKIRAADDDTVVREQEEVEVFVRSAAVRDCDKLKKVGGGAVAQLGARLDGIEEVVGSNPIGSTN